MASRAAFRAVTKLPCGIAVPLALSTVVKIFSLPSSNSGAAAIKRALASASYPERSTIRLGTTTIQPPQTCASAHNPLSARDAGCLFIGVHGPGVCFVSLISHRPFSVGHIARCTATRPVCGSAGSRRPGSAWGSWLVDLHGAVLVLDRHAPDG